MSLAQTTLGPVPGPASSLSAGPDWVLSLGSGRVCRGLTGEGRPPVCQAEALEGVEDSRFARPPGGLL